MIFWDMEVFKYDYMLSYLDTDTKKIETIVNDRDKIREIYEKYKNKIWVGYNSNYYDKYVLQGILCGFDPYEITKWIIHDNKAGYEYSSLLNKFPLISYDTLVKDKSLKELEGHLGESIVESDVEFDIDRPLTEEEIERTVKYNQYDVWQTFRIFLETKSEFEAKLGLVQEFKLPLSYIGKTKAQLASIILNASPKQRNDEFDFTPVPNLNLKKYNYVLEHYENWAKEIKDYNKLELQTEIAGVPTYVSGGGIHGAIKNYIQEGEFILADASSYFPTLMIEYDFLSRNVPNPKLFRDIRERRYELKEKGDPREFPLKILLNSTYGALKYKYNALFDPRQANNVCFNGQLLLIKLVEMLENKVKFVQYNTDGVLFNLAGTKLEDIMPILEVWEKLYRIKLELKRYNKIIQKDVNNYILIDENGKLKTKGKFVKKLNPIDYNTAILNKAVVNYLVYGISPEETIMNSNDLIDFQIIVKVSRKYDYCIYGNEIYKNKVYRLFASKDGKEFYRHHAERGNLQKCADTPDSCTIYNNSVVGKEIPDWLDKEWYINLANKRIKLFLGE